MEIFLEDGILKIEANCNYLRFKADKNLVESIVYLPDKRFEYIFPKGEQLVVFPEGAFVGSDYSFSCTEATTQDITAYRNLALNPADRRGETNYFPHSDANAVSKDWFCFESRNAIDGFINTGGHGNYPYNSWSGGIRDDLEYFLDFGRHVFIDKLKLHLRSDTRINDEGLRWDTYWKNITVEFSDGTNTRIAPIMTAEAQEFKFEPRTVTWIRLSNLIRDLSFPTRGFAALSQIEVWGNDII